MRIEIMPTLKCSLSCKGCDRGDGEGPFKDVPDFILGSKVLHLVFQKTIYEAPFEGFVVSGGEPTKYPEISNLLRQLKSLCPSTIEVKTNGFQLHTLPVDVVVNNHFSVSVYPDTEFALRRQMKVFDKLRAIGSLDFNLITQFDDLSAVNTDRPVDGFNPLQFCFMPTIIGDLQRVFPCCRAYTFERVRDSKNAYSLPVHEYSLRSLSEIIIHTDLCHACPRMYDCAVIAK